MLVADANLRDLAAFRKETERAIAKLDEGTYGSCDACGEPIGDERLEFRPYATRCVQHAT